MIVFLERFENSLEIFTIVYDNQSSETEKILVSHTSSQKVGE